MFMNTKYILQLLAITALFLSMLACNLVNLAKPNATQAPETTIKEATSTPEISSEPTATTEAPTQPADACDNPYLPVITGATWNYKLSGPIPDTYTHMIMTVGSDGFTEQDVFGTGLTRVGQWKCENGDLIALMPPNGSSGTIQSNNVQANFETKDLSGITLPGKVKSGDTWSQSLTLEGTQSIAGTELPASNKVTSNCKAIGVESVTVEAGTFDAMRVECQNIMVVTVKLGGTETSNTINLTNVTWYVENVGMVKNSTTGMGLDSTTELVSYSIP